MTQTESTLIKPPNCPNNPDHLYPNYTGKWPDSIVKAYRRRITQIEAAVNRQDLYALKSLQLEKLKGERKDQYSMRINRQYRLIVRFDKEGKLEIVNILAVEDYH